MRKLRYTSEALDNLADITAYVAISSGSRTLGEGLSPRFAHNVLDSPHFPARLAATGLSLEPTFEVSCSRAISYFSAIATRTLK